MNLKEKISIIQKMINNLQDYIILIKAKKNLKSTDNIDNIDRSISIIADNIKNDIENI